MIGGKARLFLTRAVLLVAVLCASPAVAASENPTSILPIALFAGMSAMVVGVGCNVVMRRRKVGARATHITETPFTTLLNSVPEAAWIKDMDGRYLAVNASFARLCGEFSPMKVIGRTDFDYFPRNIAECYRRNDEEVLQRMSSTLVVEPLANKEGAIKWVESTKAPYFDEEGRCAGTLGIAREITVRKDAEDTLSLALDLLRASESRYRDMISALPVGVFECDFDGNIIFANDLAWAIAGISAENRARSWADLVHPDDRAGVVMAIQRMITEQCRLDMEFRMVSDAGRITWVQALGVQRSDAGGAIISILDISERKQADERLRARKEEFRALAELSPDCIVRYDADCRRLYVNPAFAATIGLPAEDLIGQRPSDLTQSPQLRAYEEKIRTVVATGCSDVFELTWTSVDSVPVIGDVRLVPERGDAGAVVSVIAVGRDVTRLKAVEDELRRESGKLAVILQNLPGNAFTMRYSPDGQKKILWLNQNINDPSVCREKLIDVNPDQFHPDDRDLLFNVVPDRLKRMGFSEHRFRFLLRDDTYIWLHARERVREWQGGDMIVDGLLFNISEEMEAKQALEIKAEEVRESARRFRALIDNLPGLVFRKEYEPTESRIVYISAGFPTVFGADYQNMSLAERLARVWYPDDHPKLRGHEASIRNGADDAEVKVRFFHTDGSVRWGLVREKVVDRRGEFIVAEGLLLDITEEMQAKQAFETNGDQLFETVTKLHTLVTNLPGFIFRMEYSPDNVVRVLEVFGTPEKGDGWILSEGGWRAHVHPDDEEMMSRDFPARLRAEGTAEQTFRLAGAPRWVHIREKVVERIGDRMIVEGQVFDVTSEVLMRQDLEDSDKQRRRAEARLQQGNRFAALGQFAGGIAHDFNNLLGAMLGYARFIEDDAQPGSDSQRHASRIIAAGDKGRAIVDQLLNYSGQMELELSRFRIGDLVSEVVSMCSAGCEAKTTFVTDLALADMEIEADRVQLIRVLMNLCINSRDAINGSSGNSSSGTVSIGAHQTELDAEALRRVIERDEGGEGGDVEAWTDDAGYSWVVGGRFPKVLPHVCLYVADTGVGMEAKLLEQAFAPFFTTKDRSRGTGLGLAVVHGIVIAHGGALIGRSRPGEGTRFDILLPTRRLLSEPVSPVIAVEKAPQKKIMLVEDNIDVLDAVKEALIRVGYSVDAYSDPRVALEAFHATPDAWDLVVSDQIMPGIRGTELIRKMYAIRPGFPSLLCTGYAEELDGAAWKAVGINEMLRKPVGLEELFGAIQRSLAAQKTEA